MTAGRKKLPEDKDKGASSGNDQVQHRAEKHLSRSFEILPDLKGQTPEQLINELQVHQVELEMQGEELRRIQHELEKSRYTYINLYESAPVGYLTLNNKTLITKANLTAATLLGVERNSLLHHGFGAFVAPEHLGKWEQYFLTLCSPGEKEAINLIMKRNDGSLFSARLESTRITSDDGTITFHLVVSDISDITKSQDDLRKSEEKYRMMIDQAEEGVWIVDKDYRTTFVNDRLASMFGYTPQEMMGKTVREFIPADDVPIHLQRIHERIEGKNDRFEQKFFRKDGSVLWVIASVTALSEGGEFSGSFAMLTDITDRKQAEEALRTSHSRLESAMEVGNIAWWEMDCVTGKVSFSERKAQMLGYPSKQFSHYSDFTALLHPDDYEPAMQAMRDHLSGIKKNYEIEYRIRTSSGEYRWFQDRGGISACSPSGEPLQVTGLVIDITESKNAENALKESEQRYRSLTEQAHDGIYVYQDERFVFVNHHVSEITGYSKEELLAMKFIELVDPDDQALILDITGRRRLGEPVPDTYEVRIVRKDGSVRYIEIAVSVISYSGGYAVMGAARDVTERKKADEDIRFINSILSTQSEATIDGILVADASGKIISYNNRFIEMWAIPPDVIASGTDELVFLKILDKLVDPDVFRLRVTHLLSHRDKKVRDEITLLDGRILDYYTAPMIGSGAEYYGRIWNFRDITTSKKVQQNLEEARDWLKMVQRNAKAGFWTWDFTTGKLTWSEEFFELFGLPVTTEPSFENWLSVLHPEDRAAALGKIDQSVRQNTDLWNEYRVVLPGGEERWVGASGKITSDKSGQPVQMSGICLDITPQKRALKSLKESEDRYRGLVEGVPDYILVHRHGKILFVNPAASEVMGRREEDLVGSDIMQYIAPESRPLVVSMVAKRAAGEEVPPYEITIITRGGERRVTQVHGSLIMYEGESASLNVLTDITVRKRAEEAREHLMADLRKKNEELERFTYTVSHDLKSPLITIKGFLGYLEKDALAGDAARLHDDIARIHSATSRMEDFIISLLELSRIGRIVNPPFSISLESLVREAIEALNAQISERGVTFIIPENLPELYGDRVRMQQVIMNLIGNAVKFMGEQEDPRIEISACSAEGKVTVCVKDNGIGIAPENLDKLFSVFTRLNPAIPGAGIGLALVKRIVEVHGGECRVESQGLGKGCTFCFSLPDKPQAADERANDGK